MAVLRELDYGGNRHFLMKCPGCRKSHIIPVEGPHGWKWSGNKDKPTFAPSILVTGIDENGPTICHSFVREGKWEFQNDCTHSLRGQIVPMVDIPEEATP